MSKQERLDGLDLARFVALVGMVIVNFDVVMTFPNDGSLIAGALQGRAAATFVVLAGMGLGLATTRHNTHIPVRRTLRRAAFLLVIGYLNTLIFQADIIHFYAIYFLIAAFFLRAPAWALWTGIFVLTAGFVVLAVTLDYNAGWNWTSFEYVDFWTVEGFVRNLFFNGWHPVFPWLAFLLFGMWIGRLALSSKPLQVRLLAGGALALGLAEAIATVAESSLAAIDPDVAMLFGTSPVPPTPLFVLAGFGAACLTVGSCLLVAPLLRQTGLFAAMTAVGRQSLTLYIAHIVLGMGMLEALSMVGTQTGETALILAAIFCILAMGFALSWSKFFDHGPLETLMRRWAG